jgi:hypothetical protein
MLSVMLGALTFGGLAMSTNVINLNGVEGGKEEVEVEGATRTLSHSLSPLHSHYAGMNLRINGRWPYKAPSR